jgi:hypothetical protein
MGMYLRRGARLRWVALAGLVGVCLAPPMSAASLDALARSSEDRACAARTQTIQPLAVVRNTRDHDFSCLGLIVDAGAMPVAVRFEVHHGRPAAGDRQPSPPVEVKEFDRDLIASSKGAVLDGQPGHDAVILQGALPSPGGAAQLAVRYLYNGITGEWRQCGVTLRLGSERHWQLENARHEKVPAVLVRTWSLPVLGTAGIATLEGICAHPQT